jgi:hypothetical protein
VNILHISEQLEAAKAENNPEKAATIIDQFLKANGHTFEDNSHRKVADLYFTFPQSALRQLEFFSK